MTGTTLGFVQDQTGLFLFLIEADAAQVINCFIPGAARGGVEHSGGPAGPPQYQANHFHSGFRSSERHPNCRRLRVRAAHKNLRLPADQFTQLLLAQATDITCTDKSLMLQGV
jgi:hypothetical protein